MLEEKTGGEMIEMEKTGGESTGHRYITSSDLLSVTVTKDFTLVLFGAVYLQLKVKAVFSVQVAICLHTNKSKEC